MKRAYKSMRRKSAGWKTASRIKIIMKPPLAIRRDDTGLTPLPPQRPHPRHYRAALECLFSVYLHEKLVLRFMHKFTQQK